MDITHGPPYLTAKSPKFFYVWDYVPTRSYHLQVTWTHSGRWIQSERQRSRGPSPHDQQINHVRKRGDKWWWSKGLLDATWRPGDRLSSSAWKPHDLHQTDTISGNFLLTVDGVGSHDLHHTATMIRDRLLISTIRGNARDAQIFIERASEEHRGDRGVIAIRRPGCVRSFSHFIDAFGRLDLHRTDDDRTSAGLIGDDQDYDLPDCDRTAERLRSRRDHGSIVTRSWPKSTAIMALSSRNHLHDHQTASSGESRSRSWPDRGLIVAQSRGDCGPIVGLFEAKFKPFYWGFEATMPLNGNRLHDSLISPPQPHQSATIFGPIFLFKSMYFPSLFFNFWSIREEIKRISRKVLSSRDPLLPRV